MASLLISALVTSCVSVPLPKVTTIRGKPGAPRVAMPSVALGNAGGCHPDPNGNEATDPTCPAYNVVLSAIDVGYRSFHDALSYSNQAGLGAALKEAMTGARQVPRADLFAMSMVPKYLMGYNLTKRAVHASLQQLELAYIDLVMVHHRAADVTDWPRTVSTMHAFPADFVYPRNPVVNGSKSQWFTPPCALADGTWTQCQDETWRALIEMRDAGLIRAIGVSNWQVSNLARMKAMGHELPAVNQIEQHIGWHDDAMLEWCAKNDIVLQAATPLARSLPSLVEAGVEPVISGIATKYNKSVAQVALRFLIEKGVAPLASAHSVKYQTENLNIFDFKLTAEEVVSLSLLTNMCRGKACDGLAKCWADPGTMMCSDLKTGRSFHCP